MANPRPDDIIQCPYNAAHVVEHSRMNTHLNKCRRNYTGLPKAKCPFDVTHIVNEAELDYHITVCIKRGMFDRQKYIMNDDYRPQVEIQRTQPIMQGESWDDVNTTSYVPDPSKQGNHIIKKIRGATPSERRKARQEAIVNYKPLEEGQ